MRVYGRVYDIFGNPTWIVVETLPNGLNDYVYITALIQDLKLNLGESPFFGNDGIPAANSVIQQIAPDYYSALVQLKYSQFFMALSIVRDPNGLDRDGKPAPFYRVNITTHYGVTEEIQVPV